MATFYIADTHFGHENIIRLSGRPFTSLDEMNDTLLRNWNARVKNSDDIYIIGDLWYRGVYEDALQTVKQLKGKKHLIIGNHDRKYLKNAEYADQFAETADILDLPYENKRLILCHYPLAEWNAFFRGSYHVYGHIHNDRGAAFQYMKTLDRALNAGVDINYFIPVTLDELIQYNSFFKNQ